MSANNFCEDFVNSSRWEKSLLSIFAHVHSAFHAACLNIQERFNSNSKPSAGFYGTKKDRCIVQRSLMCVRTTKGSADAYKYSIWLCPCLRVPFLVYGGGRSSSKQSILSNNTHTQWHMELKSSGVGSHISSFLAKYTVCVTLKTSIQAVTYANF